jgi:hypothetical protein
MWSAFHTNLYQLARERPWEGDLLDLFNALERWEVAVGDGRDEVERSSHDRFAQRRQRITASENAICRLVSRSWFAGAARLMVTSGFDTPRSGGRLELLH